MAKLLKLRRGTTSQHNSFTGAEGECTIDTTKDTLVVHDGSQAGGRALLREDVNNLAAGAITETHLASNSVDSAELKDGSIDESHIADNQVTLAKMAGIARGKIIYGDANGNPAYLTIGSDQQVLGSNGTDISWVTNSTGATGGNNGLNRVFYENDNTVTHDYTITNNKNAMSAGPITISATVTIGAGENWSIV